MGVKLTVLCPLRLREEHRLSRTEVRRKVFGPHTDEILENWTKNLKCLWLQIFVKHK